jgi:membrane protein implicated in regulation of membrane protease activity
MGSVDRGIRIVVGLVLIALVFVGPQTMWGWIGIIPLATALIGWCPAYTILGVKTCK